jgi:hypothetical protein
MLKGLAWALLLIAFVAAGQFAWLKCSPQPSNPRQTGENSLYSERNDTDAKTSYNTAMPLPLWFLSKVQAETVEGSSNQITDQCGQCSQTKDWAKVFLFYGCAGRAYFAWAFSTPEKAIASFTGVLAFFTLALWAATTKLAKVSEQALTKLERAFPGEFQIRQGVDGTKVTEYEFRLQWENSGSTVARQFLLHINWDTFLDDIPPNYGFPDRGLKAQHPTFLGPKAKTSTAPFAIDVATIEAVRVHQIRLFVYGWATYHDIFEGTPQHITRFCTELYQIDGDPYAFQKSCTWNWRSYTRHNCVDEDCES